MARSKYTTAVASQLVKTGGGALYGVYALNAGAATRYVWIFDGTSSAGTLLSGPFPVASGESVSVQYELGMRDMTPATGPLLPEFTTGLFIASSTTATTFTQSGTNDLMGLEVEYS